VFVITQRELTRVGYTSAYRTWVNSYERYFDRFV